MLSTTPLKVYQIDAESTEYTVKKMVSYENFSVFIIVLLIVNVL